ncbi:Bromodomain Adjacent To Zinc Finger Domain Protein 2B [Manis pentadactyla]|nr:Bromodomain Adjacent To Zinc Finger Domain Protein 2B [Manis pentadactyla]
MLRVLCGAILSARMRGRHRPLSQRHRALLRSEGDSDSSAGWKERERRRQHRMFMKTMEVRKKAEEKERSKQEKRDGKRLKKELKLEQRRLELEIAKELKKPNEDMCLADQKPLPELPRIPGLVLSGSTFSNCLVVLQFLGEFGKALGFNGNTDVPNLSIIQEGLLNLGDSMDKVQDLLVRLLSAAVCDPGLITGYKAETALGEHLLNVGMNRDNVSEILQIFMEARCGQTELTESLRTKAFQAHTPAQKASALAFLISELACSRRVVSEIDKNTDYMSNLRREKWMVEGKLRKLRIIYAKKAGKRDTSGGIDLGEEQHESATPTAGCKRRRKGGDSDADGNKEEEEEDKEDKKGKKTDVCEDEDEGDQAASVEELEKQIEKLSKQQSQYRRELFDASHSLRSMMFGQDRYRRRYWIFPQCGGIFVEGMESAAGLEEIAKEREKLKSAESIQIKEEIFDTSEDTLNCSNPDHWLDEHDGEFTGEEESSAHALERKSDNPLDTAVTRLAELERNIERRYLRSPLSTTIQIKLDNVGTVTVPAPAPSISGDDDGIEEDIVPGLRLQKSIAWEKSIMKAYCQICQKGDNEELLLLCDGCDKGHHTYCHRPKITAIPDGYWFCPACIARQVKLKQDDSKDLTLCSTILTKMETCLSKDMRKRKMEENTSCDLPKQESFSSKKLKHDDSKDLTLCSMILTEMETHEDAWPFLLPVNLKLVPGYKKVIKKPMDFSTIREKLSSGQYPNLEAFAVDVRLVFDNCEAFIEDDSDIGRAGHSMRKYFEKKWIDTL